MTEVETTNALQHGERSLDVLKGVSHEAKSKFDHTDWAAVEVQATDFTKAVYACLKDFAAGNKGFTEAAKQVVMGEEFYLSIRPLLDDFVHSKLGKLVRPLPTKSKIERPSGKKEVVSTETKEGEIKKVLTKAEKAAAAAEKKAAKLAEAPVHGKKTGGGKKKAGKTIKEIRAENSQASVAKAVADVLASFRKEEMKKVYGLTKSKYVEMKGVTMMYCAWFILKAQPTKYSQKSESGHLHLPEVYELIVGIQKFIRASKDYVGKSILDESASEKVSSTMIGDLTYWMRELLGTFPFDGILLYKICPKLVIFTDYDSAIPATGIAPRKNQVDVVTAVKAHAKGGFFISYKAMAASGKTTVAAVCIPTIIEQLNIAARAASTSAARGAALTVDEWGRRQLIFACTLASVKGQVANAAFNAGIKFGVAHVVPPATIGAAPSIRIKNHDDTTDGDRVLIICGADSARELLLQEERRITELPYDSALIDRQNRYWLFVDEPTISADKYGSDTLVEISQLLMHMPGHTILSSATMCELDRIAPVMEYHLLRHSPVSTHGDGGIHVETIYSTEIEIGCELRTFSGRMVLPHAGCTTMKALKLAIATIIAQPFLGRLYTAQGAQVLHERLTAEKVPGLPNMALRFSDAANLSLDRVRAFCMEMLTILAETNDVLVTRCCKDGKEKKKGSVSSLDDGTLGTTSAYRFLNMNLIADTNPLEFAKETFAPLLAQIKASAGVRDDIELAHKLNLNYEREKEIFQKQFLRLDKRVTDDVKRSQQQQQMKEEQMPRIAFPEEFQINTLAHIKKYARHATHLSGGTSTEVRTPYSLERIPYSECLVPDWVMLLLYAGVGIYSPSNELLNEAYNKTVLQMAATGSLAYLIADRTISYGTNYPIYRVFVTKRFADDSSINTIFQILSRTGRVGQSWRAEAFIDESTVTELLKYVSDAESSSVNLEAQNIRRCFLEQVEDERKAPSVAAAPSKPTESKATIDAKKKVSRAIAQQNRRMMKFQPSAKAIKARPQGYTLEFTGKV